MTRDRVTAIIGIGIVANVLIWVWVAVSPTLAALGLAVISWAAAAVCWLAYRNVEGALFQAQLELSTIRPEEREEAKRRQASQQEVARVAKITRQQGWYFPEDDHGPSLPPGYGFPRG